MLKNYLKTAWRGLQRNISFSLINIAGLSIGISCFLLIMLYVMDEWGYDKYNLQSSRIYRINDHIKFGDFKYNGAQTPGIMAATFAKDFNQIEQVVRLKENGGLIIHKDNNNFKEDKVVYADTSVFKVFTLPFIAGDPVSALKEPHSIVISQSISQKYFKSDNSIGKILLVNNNESYKITGVIKDVPAQSHFHFDCFLPLSQLEQSSDNSWFNANFYTYILVKPGTDIKRLEAGLNSVVYKSSGPQFKTELNISQDAFDKAGNKLSCSLMPLTNIHLFANLENELEKNGSIQFVYIFSAVAIFILLIACINFMNLSTAQSAGRSKEVGVRKVLGSIKSDLIKQFLTESLLVSLISFLVASSIAALLLPFFGELTDKKISVGNFLRPEMILIICCLSVIVGFLAGIYPAFFLASFKPIEVLKGKLFRGFKGSALRNSLVVFQFTISMILMFGTIVIHNQLNFLQNKKIGFNKEQVLVVQNAYALDNNTAVFRNELLKIPAVKNITVTGFLPIAGARGASGFVTTPSFDGKNFTLMQQWQVDENYISTLQLELKAGRNFSPQPAADSNAILINETAAASISGDPINKKIYRIEDLSTGRLSAYTIVGVVKNFNFSSLRESIAPLVLSHHPDNGGMAIRINTSDVAGLISQVQEKWQSLAPGQPLSYTFLDEEYNKQYRADQRTAKLSLIFSILAILIACLGLFGIVSYAAQHRIKEIGIRKVLGAAVFDIFGMLSMDFIKLVLTATIIAAPISWWLMHVWLQDFAYRIPISWWMFVLVGAAALFIAFATLSYQTIKAALANPVESLRVE